MKTHNFLLIWLLLFAVSPSLRAQSPREERIDSLKTQLKTLVSDSVKFKTLGTISWEYISNNQLDSARHYTDCIRLLAEETNDEKGIAYAEFYYGTIARHSGNFSQALDHLNVFVNLHQKLGDSTRVAHGLFQVGVVNLSMGNYEKSLATFYRILTIYEAQESPFDIGYTLNGIGVIYKDLKKYDDAIRTYQKALAIYDDLDAADDKANVLHNLANVYADTHRFDEAKFYFKQALLIDEALGIEKWIAYDYDNIGVMYNRMEKYDSALVYQQQALAIYERLPGKNEYATSLLQIGETYYLMKKFLLAKQHLMKSVKLASEIKSKPTLRDGYSVLAKVCSEEKNFREAYEYHSLFAATNDSLLNEETSQQLVELQTKYETEKREKQIVLLAHEKEVQAKETQRQTTLKQASLGGLFAVLLVAGLLIYTLRQRLKNQKILVTKNEEIKQAKFKQQLSELEMKALRAQMNPHFIFNCINSINRLVLSGEGEGEDASRYLSKFAKLIRLMLENSEYPTVSLEDELVMLEAYLQLESLRFKEEIRYQIVVDDTIDRETTCLPAMVLQPFVENAIWHGLMPKEGDGLIKITIQEDEDGLKCIIEDNGVGREKALALTEGNALKKRSLGLEITEERLKLLSKERLRELIRITDLKDSMNRALGTRVDVLIPIS